MITTQLIEAARVERGINYKALAARLQMTYTEVYASLKLKRRTLKPDETIKMLVFFKLDPLNIHNAIENNTNDNKEH